MMIKNILCVDDVENNLFVISNLLLKVQNYAVYTARSGQIALEILLKEKIDLVLLDIMMPEMDGFEVASLIKSSPMTKDIPIIFVTAKTDEESLKEAYEKGGIDYIVKPYRSYELLERVRFHLELKEVQEQLKEREKVLLSIINQQDNMIISTNGKKVFMANKAFLKFFKLFDSDDLESQMPNILQYFKGCKHCDIEELKKQDNWLEYICNSSQNLDFVVVIQNPLTLQDQAFMLKATKMDIINRFILTFTDVTNLVIESKEFETKANHDSLTGLYNRDKLNEFMKYEIEIAKRYKGSLSIILFDIDNFKKINDTYGHLNGDMVLKKISNEVLNIIRKTDLFARWGGEEFIIVLPSSAINSAINLAQKIRKSIENIVFENMNTVTCSFGVSTFEDSDDMKTILKRVDEAMYQAKSLGKNRVETK